MILHRMAIQKRTPAKAAGVFHFSLQSSQVLAVETSAVDFGQFDGCDEPNRRAG
jgi:hypothetical protein